MGIGALQTTDYRTDYAGYSVCGNQRVNDFYNGLSSASEKSDSNGVGDVLGLTMIRKRIASIFMIDKEII